MRQHKQVLPCWSGSVYWPPTADAEHDRECHETLRLLAATTATAGTSCDQRWMSTHDNVTQTHSLWTITDNSISTTRQRNLYTCVLNTTVYRLPQLMPSNI